VSASFKSVALDEVADLNPRLIEMLAPNDTVSFVPMSAVSAETAGVTEEETRTFAEVAKGYTPFVTGDVLVAKITPCFENGKIAQALLTHRVGFGSTEFHVVRPHANKLDARYALHFLRRGNVRLAGERRMTGSAGQRRVPENFLAKLKIPLPPLAEQRRIAEVLDRAEALRAKRRAALAQLDSLTQSLFLDLFGDPLTKNGGSVVHVPFESVTRRITYGFTCPMKHLDLGIPIITAKNVRDGFIDFENVHNADKSEFDALTAKSKPVRGDVLITKDGTIGRCAVVERDEPFCINQSVALIQPDHAQVLPSYMVAYLSTDRVQHVIKNMGKGNALAHLQITELAELPMPLPPHSLQREFARRVTAVEALKTAQSASLAELDALFAILQHRAFRGDL